MRVVFELSNAAASSWSPTVAIDTFIAILWCPCMYCEIFNVFIR